MRRTKSFNTGITQVKEIIFYSRASMIIAAEIFVGFILCGLSLFIFFELTEEVLERELHYIDVLISQSVYLLRTPFLTNLMFVITELGSLFVLALVSLISIIFLLKHHKKEAILFSLAVVMGIVINTALKSVVQRPRPELSPLISESMSSFPSGHAMNAFIFFALLSFFSFHFFRNKVLTVAITAFSILCILLVGFSRIYLGVHYLTDVIGGYIAGFCWFVTVLLVDRTLVFYKLFRKSE